jgi:hypothetical protein
MGPFCRLLCFLLSLRRGAALGELVRLLEGRDTRCK